MYTSLGHQWFGSVFMSGSGSAIFFLQNFHIFQAVPESECFAIPYLCTVFLLGPPWRISKLQEKPIFPEMEFLGILERVTSSFNHVSFFVFFVDHFPDSEDSGSRIRIRRPIQSGSGSGTLHVHPVLLVLILLPFRTLYHICTYITLTVHVASVADPGCLSRIPDPDFYPSRIPDPGSRIPDPKTATKERGEKN